jgi:hypothetical protein
MYNLTAIGGTRPQQHPWEPTEVRYIYIYRRQITTGNQSHWLADLLSLLRPECVALLRHRWRVGSAQSLRPGRFRRPQFKCHVQSIQKPDVHQKLQVLCVKLRSPLTCCLIHPAQLSWETPNPWRMSQLGCYLTRKSDGFRNHVRVRISIQYIYIYIIYYQNVESYRWINRKVMCVCINIHIHT